MTIEQISDELIKAFPVETKIRGDFIEFLMEAGETANEDIFSLLLYEENSIDNPIVIELSKNELLKIVLIKPIFNYLSNSSEVEILIGIGQYTPPDSSGIFFFDKCLLSIRYNADLSYFDFDFYYSKTLNPRYR